MPRFFAEGMPDDGSIVVEQKQRVEWRDSKFCSRHRPPGTHPVQPVRLPALARWPAASSGDTRRGPGEGERHRFTWRYAER